MYICLCHAVTDQQIREAVDDGARSMEELQALLEVSTCCGSCTDDAQACLRQQLQQEPAAA